MTILEAIKSGKKIGRNGWSHFREPNTTIFMASIGIEDIIATDWEIAEELPLVLDHKKLNSIKAELEGYREKQEFPLFSFETARLFNELIRLAHLGIDAEKKPKVYEFESQWRWTTDILRGEGCLSLVNWRGNVPDTITCDGKKTRIRIEVIE